MAERPGRDLDRLTVAQAAGALGISQDAVRKRIARGTIPHDRDEAGRIHVYVPASKTVHKTDQDLASKTVHETDQDARLRDLQDQVRFLREELERTHAIVRNLTERIPQLEAPQEAREAPAHTDDATNTTEEPTGEPRRSWWRRIFGGG